MYTPQYGYKHAATYRFLLVPISIFTTVALLPHPALASEVTTAFTRNPKFIAAAYMPGRDPYLAQAINSMPEYGYTAAGSTTAAPSPVTIQGDWPVTRAWKPVPAFTVTGTPTPKPAPKAVAVSPVTTPNAAPAPTPVPQIATATPKPVPQTGAPVVLEGEASYYSRAGCLGCDPNVIMANGQPLNDSALTMAIGANLKHLVGHQARVTSLATGKSTMVRITDTGGFYKAKYGHRVADLTIATKQAIGMAGGVGQVRVEVF